MWNRSSLDGGPITHETAPSDLERFHHPTQPLQSQTFGFQGYPDGYMFQPKQPLRVQASADATRDVNRYFRKDSPLDRYPTPPTQLPPKEPEWLKPKSPREQQQGSLSPRYEDPPSRRKQPVIRDPMRELTSRERQRKVEEHYIAEEDRAEAMRRKQDAAESKRDEQRKPRYQPQPESQPRYQPQPESPGKPAREQDLKMDRVPQNVEDVRGSSDYDTQGKQDIAKVQESQINELQNEIDKLKGQGGYPEVRAQSDPKKFAVYADKPQKLDKMSFLGFLYAEQAAEPQTDRGQRRQRDREIWGHHRMAQSSTDYLSLSPRKRDPIGSFFIKDSTYKSDFDEPTVRRGRNTMGDGKKDKYVPFHPFGRPGGGAPMSDDLGKMQTRNKGAMVTLGREHSNSAKARRTHKSELLHTIQEQMAFEKQRKVAEKEYAKQPFRTYATSVRDMAVGYAKYKKDGLIDNHHLPHSMSNPYQSPPLYQQRQYHSFLQGQIDERNKMTRLSQLEDRRQANAHFQNFDDFFGHYGGGNVKGNDTRKVNLERAIHAPQDAMTYRGGAPYAEYTTM